MIDQGIRQSYRLADDTGPEDGPLPARRRLIDAIRERDAALAERAMQELIRTGHGVAVTHRHSAHADPARTG
ncbi:hypothetical protein [Actinacidiphila paucisporea]|uniref:Uncharacterized protein n=1 Tax=Actinacidiphila paucisporea TaxID=310782 RepID=A0A1M7P4T7_9ACTN|nr:hypothetical protein [Actinacidiphila paucisporea]SHN11643.1 hypothetical protein SAMN05216499_12150 [Actinacidiphila paucisporea]